MEYQDQEEHGHGHGQEEEIGMTHAYDVCQDKTSSPKHVSDSEPLPLHMVAESRPRYRECLKNQAVGLGTHAVDGCCEFLPAGPDGTLDALKCAACNCHRNFHRKAMEISMAENHPPLGFHHYNLLLHCKPPPYYRTPSGYLHVTPRPLALPSTSGGGGELEQEDVLNLMNGGSKKRHRTKFTQEQKDKMLKLAEKLEWRIQKNDEDAVEQFCHETGVKRHVLKVWMHNNKHTLGFGGNKISLIQD